MIRDHAGRLTVGWIGIDPEWMDFAVASLRARQVAVYVVFDGNEDHGFRERFRGTRTAARLDDGSGGPVRAGPDLRPSGRGPLSGWAPGVPRPGRPQATLSDHFRQHQREEP